jgi:hypothetical protein
MKILHLATDGDAAPRLSVANAGDWKYSDAERFHKSSSVVSAVQTSGNF